MTSKALTPVPWTDVLYPDLRKEDGTAELYIQVAVEDGDISVLKLVLRDCIKARSSYTTVAKKMGVARETLSHMLSPKGNPTLKNVVKIVRALGYELAVVKAGTAYGQK